jgi:hypothetical protein
MSEEKYRLLKKWKVDPERNQPVRSDLSESDTVRKYILPFTFEILLASGNKFEEIR